MESPRPLTASPPPPPPLENPLLSIMPPPSQPQPPPSSSSSPSSATAAPTNASRRLPPPCWSHEETVALIDSYREIWYTLRRGNLRALHWEEVAEAVARRCPRAIPPKTSVQCRHKMEKLRKRYRTELQRAQSIPNHRFSSSWIYFKKMDAMEKGPSASSPNLAVDSDADGQQNWNDVANNEDDDDEFDDDNHEDTGSYMLRNHDPRRSFNGGNGFRIRIPGSSSAGSGFNSKNHGKFEENPCSGPNGHKPKYGFSSHGLNEEVKYSTRVVKNGFGSGSKPRSERRDDEVNEMVAAINMLGEGLVKTERMKIDMMREIERMRMDMEMKRTKMILESQQQIVEAFVKGVSDRQKKARRMPSPDS